MRPAAKVTMQMPFMMDGENVRCLRKVKEAGEGEGRKEKGDHGNFSRGKAALSKFQCAFVPVDPYPMRKEKREKETFPIL